MSKLGARPGGRSYVVITDLREELVVYVNGKPYLRRELEMPSAALHHAGLPLSSNRYLLQPDSVCTERQGAGPKRPVTIFLNVQVFLVPL